MSLTEELPIKKKRGRKPKVKIPENDDQSILVDETIVSAPKKRGRKPKGGKIIDSIGTNDLNAIKKENVILHLKCKQNSLHNSGISLGTLSMNDTKITPLHYENLGTTPTDDKVNVTNDKSDTESSPTSQVQNRQLVWRKIRELQKLFHNNTDYGKQSACFWCTYDFDTPTISIPKARINGQYQTYGCFCSPECGVAFLMNELIDTSQKYERYHLMNYIYVDAYNYDSNIKPAPNPHYLLDKFYGNLTIQEYRQLHGGSKALSVVEKPLSKTYPEIHEESNETFGSTTSLTMKKTTFQIKRKSKSQPITKAASMIENFGFAANP